MPKYKYSAVVTGTMEIEYTLIYLQGKIFRQFCLPIWTLFIGQFINLVGGSGMG